MSDIDCYVVSYPKSGRTWLNLFLGLALCYDRGDLDEQMIFSPVEFTEAAGGPVVGFSHAGTRPSRIRRFTDLAWGIDQWTGSKVVLLVRDPRDVLVSFFLHMKKRGIQNVWKLDWSMEEFIRSPFFGARKWGRFHRQWADNIGRCETYAILHYESLLQSPGAHLEKFIEFLGFKVSDEAVRFAVEETSFASMRKMEEEGRFRSPMLRPGDPEDPESYKCRRGMAGGYVDYLDPADLEYIRWSLEGEGWPFCAHMKGALEVGACG